MNYYYFINYYYFMNFHKFYLSKMLTLLCRLEIDNSPVKKYEIINF